MPRDDSAYLLDMLLAARDALSFTEGMSYSGFVFDRRTQLSHQLLASAADFGLCSATYRLPRVGQDPLPHHRVFRRGEVLQGEADGPAVFRVSREIPQG